MVEMTNGVTEARVREDEVETFRAMGYREAEPAPAKAPARPRARKTAAKAAAKE